MNPDIGCWSGPVETMRGARVMMSTGALLLSVLRLDAMLDGVQPQQVVDLLNSIRASAVPTAARMVQLEWDASLAAAATKFAGAWCTGRHGTTPSCPSCARWIVTGQPPSYATRGFLDIIPGVFMAEVRPPDRSCDLPPVTLRWACGARRHRTGRARRRPAR